MPGALYGKHGEVLVCFGSDDFFHPVKVNEDGTHDPVWEEKLVSVNDAFYLADEDDLGHNEQHAGSTVAVEVE
jgi:hypothetical protein